MPNKSMKIKYDKGSKVDQSDLAELERQAQLDENSFEDSPSINEGINNKNTKTLLKDAEDRIEKEQERKEDDTDRQMREAAEKHFRRDLNEGGSMLVPPEMEALPEQDIPIDTYDNIPVDEIEVAEASQLPDEQVEDNYLEYVLNESLDPEDQEYLMGVLETDERLSNIFDKVMDVATEFSGEGEVDGPGTGVSDSIPARLSDGEFVFTKKATDQLGSDQLQIMMDDAERAFDGGYMKKAFGGMVDDIPMDDRKEDEEINSMMISSNQMPSVRPR
jgi:hypothetical protein